ncbi:MAG: hypothetical protein QXU47_06940 [Candidatus Bathyarchaeia archaeon]
MSVSVIDDKLIALLREYRALILSLIDIGSGRSTKLAKFEGSRGFILGGKEGRFLIAVNDGLYLVEDYESELVLKTVNPKNFFWHAACAQDRFFIHEYGETPTGIFASEDFKNWNRLITNADFDKHSKHFHFIKYDPYRSWLIVTLGDGCVTRVVHSEDSGNTWRPLYRGPWQFVPIEILEDRIVFGMDSGIARGGIGVYNPENNRWDFTFLKWHDREVRLAQMCDLKRLDNDIWMATLGTPQAVIVSRNLKTWYVAYVEGFDRRFNYNMSFAEGKNFVACSTGNNLLIFEKGELAELAQSAQQVLVAYEAYIDRLKGFGFVLKKLFAKLPIYG